MIDPNFLKAASLSFLFHSAKNEALRDDTDREKLCFIQFITKMFAWLLLTFYRFLHSIIMY